MARAGFSPRSKTIIAARSGYRCSIPDCNCLTIGPGAQPHEIANRGVAAHIFAASAGGPRGSGGLSADELKLPENGVWLCANHARQVDANRGTQYPPALLLSYKTLQEARTAWEMQSVASPFGWFQELRIQSSPVLSPGTVIRFGKLTLLLGDNGTGKSALCRWVSGFCDPRFLGTWLHGVETYPIDVSVRYYAPGPAELRLLVDHHGRVKYSDGTVDMPLNVRPARVIFPHSDSLQVGTEDEPDDLEMVSQALGIERCLVEGLFDEVQEYENGTVNNLRVERGNRTAKLFASVSRTAAVRSYGQLSGGERERVILELSLAAARASARQSPTLLVIDGFMTLFDTRGFGFYVKLLSDARNLFQTIMAIPNVGIDIGQMRWLGWEIVRMNGFAPNVTVEQSVRE